MINPLPALEALIVANELRKWIGSGEIDRLMDLLDRRFGDRTGLSAAQLEIWKQDEEFQKALFAISYSGRWDPYREALRQAVLKLIAEDSDDPAQHETDLCDEVVAAIEELLSYAKRGDQVTRYEVQQTRALVEEQAVYPLRLDWVPDRAQDLVDELANESPKEALSLEKSLKGQDPAKVLSGHIEHPPKWIGKDGSGLLYEVLAALAEDGAQWELAKRASKEAAERPGSDRARTLVRASIAANVLGRDAEADDLLNRAEAIDAEHPGVLLARFQRADSAEDKLALADRVQPRKPRHEGAKAAARAEALVALGHLADARAALAEADEGGAGALRLRDIEADLAMEENRSRWLSGERVDVPALKRAAGTYIAQRDEHRCLKAFRGSAAYTMKAADAFLRADEVGELRRLLSPAETLREELDVPGTREGFAEVLTKGGRPDLALEVLPEEKAREGPAELIRAMAIAQAGNEQQVPGAVKVLDRELSGEHRLPAALGRLLLAATRGLDWSEKAEEVIGEVDPILAQLLKGQWLGENERWDEAEKVLEAAGDEPRVQLALINAALAQEDKGRVRHRAERLLDANPDYAATIEVARALIRIDEWEAAKRELERLKDDEEAPEAIRINALGELTQAAFDAERFRDVLNLTETWLQIRPDVAAAWGRVHALARLGRNDDALAVIEEHELVPRQLSEARVAARLYALGIGGEEALRLIIELADAQDPPDEDLEAVAVMTLLGLTERPSPDVLERVSAEHFVERFPNSSILWSVKAPQTEEEIRSFIKEMTAGRADAIKEAESGVFDVGSAPSAVLAIAAGRHVGQLWRLLGRRPVGYGDATLEDMERSDASGALGLGAVWDPSSLTIVGGLSAEAGGLARRVLPRSVIPQSTLDDLMAEGPEIEPGERRPMVVGTDAQGEPWVREWTEEEVADDRAVGANVRHLGSELDVEPDAPPEDDGPEAKLLRTEEELPLQLRTFGATFAVARRMGLPIFSDDRLVRLRARQAGLRSFGSVALLDALEARGDLTSDDRKRARRAIRARGTTGLIPSSEELVTEVEEANYVLTPEVAITLNDPLLIRADIGRGLNSLIAVLRSVREGAPGALRVWTARALFVADAAIRDLGPAILAGVLLMLAWPSSEEDDETFVADLAVAVKGAVRDLGAHGDPIAIGLDRFLRATGRQRFPAGIRTRLVHHFIDQMPIEDRHQLRMGVLGFPERTFWGRPWWSPFGDNASLNDLLP